MHAAGQGASLLKLVFRMEGAGALSLDLYMTSALGKT